MILGTADCRIIRTFRDGTFRDVHFLSTFWVLSKETPPYKSNKCKRYSRIAHPYSETKQNQIKKTYSIRQTERVMGILRGVIYKS